jgi:hypothetical protein
MAQLHLCVGRLHWGAVRDAISRCQFEGYKLDVHEGSGLLDREFLIRGDNIAITLLTDWAARNVQ